MSGVIQVAFDGLKIIDLGKTVALEIYQSLFGEKSDPVGLNSIVQAFGQLQVSDNAVRDFNGKWTNGSRRGSLKGTSVEIITGKSSTGREMAKTRNGEGTLVIVAFLIEALTSETVSELARRIIDETPDHLLTTRPKWDQVSNTISAVESQIGNVSWQLEISKAQDCVGEQHVVWTQALSVPMTSSNIPIEGISALYRVLIIVSRFPDDFHCVLRTSLSITLPFVLVHTICGLRVCVVVNGRVLYGDATMGQWQVKLEREECEKTFTEVKLWHKLDDPEILLKTDNTGPRRANRIAINGIARAATIDQGLDIDESYGIAKIAIWAAESILARWTRARVEDSSDLQDTSSTGSEVSAVINSPDSNVYLVPIKTRLTTNAICTWWGCSAKTALDMRKASAVVATKQAQGVSWKRLHFPEKIRGKISEFKDLKLNEQMTRRSQNYNAFDENDFGRLTHLLTVQLLLITLLQGELRAMSMCAYVPLAPWITQS